jgi:hypothetical protein
MVIAGGLAGFFIGRKSSRPEADLSLTDNGDSQCVDGDWGSIRFWHSMIEMPPELLTIYPKTSPVCEWYFGVATTDELCRALQSCDIEPSEISTMMKTSEAWPAGGFVLRPPDESVLALKSEARGKLYALLATWPLNATYQSPTQFEKSGDYDWFEATRLPAEVIETVRKLVFRQENVEFFCDYEVVLRHISDAKVARDFLRVMSRQNTSVGVLSLRPDEDVEPLVRYWGRAGRERMVRPILEMAGSRSKGRHEIALSLLLPRFVRDHLYRYPSAIDPRVINCHYSSLNFFDPEPNAAYTNLIAAAAAIDRDYVPVTGARQLGDIALFMRGEREVIHSCNVVAGDIVFSKNGNSIGQPWILADLGELKEFYGVKSPVSIRFVRRRDLAAATAAEERAEPGHLLSAKK